MVACEFSGIVRDAFIRAGHDAVSCDILPCESPLGEHLQCPIEQVDLSRYDMLIGHPPCTYLCNSGVRWLYEDDDRWLMMEAGARFFRYLWNAPVEHIAIENPIPHKFAVRRIGARYSQLIQPWQFGHGETKAICLWLKALTRLDKTDIVEGRTPRVHHMSPGADRGKERSRFYTGIADAMATQWCAF